MVRQWTEFVVNRTYRPNVVKFTKEKESRRLEEVNLDTGQRRSWVETNTTSLTSREKLAKKARTPLE